MKRKGGNSCEIDERLARAAETSLKTKSISPVLREELRLSILNRRHANGQEEIEVEFKEPEKHELTPWEIEKKLKRREQNRRAARRCREKKKNRQEGTFLGLAQMMEENKSLEAEINLLKSQKTEIQRFLNTHNICFSVKHEQSETSLPQCEHSTTNLLEDLAACSCDVTASLQPTACQTYSQNPTHGQPLVSTSSRDLEDPLPQSLIEFCLEHSSTEEDLLYDCSADMRRQAVSVSSVSSDADVFGMESDSDTVILTNDNSGLNSEDEDVFQSNVPWTLAECQPVSLLNNNESYLPLGTFETASSRDSGSACGEISYMQYLNFAEP